MNKSSESVNLLSKSRHIEQTRLFLIYFPKFSYNLINFAVAKPFYRFKVPAIVPATHSNSSTHMKHPKLGTNFAVFIIFFGIALIEAFQKQNWLEAALFVLLGLLFVRADT